MKFFIQLFLFLGVLFFSFGETLYAQAPHKVNYQSVVRDASGEVIVGTSVGVQLSILQGSASGSSVYSETHSATTNDFGLINLQLGNGSSGDNFGDIDWTGGPYFIKVAMDVNGGTSYSDYGTSELVSVPFALMADSAMNDAVDDDDADPLNEIQSLSISGDSVYLTDGGAILLPANLDNDSTNELIHDALLNGTDLEITDAGNTYIVDLSSLIDDEDADSTNEIQTLTIMNDTIQLSNGGGQIILPQGEDIAQTLDIGNDADSLTLVNLGALAVGQNFAYANVGVDVKVKGSNLNFGTWSEAADSSAQQNIGIYNNVAGGSNWNVGSQSFASGGQSSLVYGAYGDASGETDNIKRGVVGVVQGDVDGMNDAAVYGIANGTGENISVYGRANNSNGSGGKNIGLVGHAEGADTNWSIYALTGDAIIEDNLGVGVREPGAKIHAHGDSLAIMGVSDGLSGNSWQNSGVAGETNTDNNPGRGVWAYVYGAQTGFGTFSEAATDATNNGIGAYALSTPSNSSIQIGVRGIAQSDWTSVNPGTGTHYGGYFYGSGDGSFNYGMRADANTTNTSANNRGVEGNALSASASVNFGGTFYATPSSTQNYNAGALGYAGNNSITNYGLYGFGTGSSGSITDGVYGYSNSSSATNQGVDGTSEATGTDNIGVGGYAFGTVSGSNTNYGLYGYADSSPEAYGVYATSTGSNTTNYGVYAEASNASTNYAGYFDGNVTVTGNLNVTGNISKGGGTFKIDHPLDPANKYLVHSFVESPEMINVYSGKVTTDAEGFATVALPAYFEAANDDVRYQLTVIGSFAQAIIAEEVVNNSFRIQTSDPNIKVSWEVTGVRNDAYANANRIVPVQTKEGDEAGKYLHPELYGASDADAVYPSKSNADRIMKVKTDTQEAADPSLVEPTEAPNMEDDRWSSKR